MTLPLPKNTVLSLSEKQKALSDYAETAQTQTYVAAANNNGGQSGQIQQVKRPAKPQVRWAIPEEKLKELLWKRAQLLQFERARAAREKTSQATKAKPRGPPPKLGKPKSASEKGAQGAASGAKPKASQVSSNFLQTLSGDSFPPRTHKNLSTEEQQKRHVNKIQSQQIKPSPPQAPPKKAPETPKPKPASNQGNANAKPKPKPAPIDTKQAQGQQQTGKTATAPKSK